MVSSFAIFFLFLSNLIKIFFFKLRVSNVIVEISEIRSQTKEIENKLSEILVRKAQFFFSLFKNTYRYIYIFSLFIFLFWFC